MNIVLWILQAALAFLLLGGGFTKTFKIDALASMPAMNALPRIGWQVLGVLEIVCALLLIVPAAFTWRPHLTPLAAAIVTVESVVLAVLYGRASLKLEAANPFVWSVLMAVLAVCIAYGRHSPGNVTH